MSILVRFVYGRQILHCITVVRTCLAVLPSFCSTFLRQHTHTKKRPNRKGLVALVTGAGERLGKTTAERLLKQGARLILVDKKDNQCPELLAQDSVYIPVDFHSESEIKSVFDIAREKFGRLDVTINCHEEGGAKVIHNFRKNLPPLGLLENINHLIKYNLVSTFDICRHSACLMSENEPDSNGQRGCIINTSHMAAEEGIMGHVPYSATKGAINSMTLPLSRDLASLGVRVNTVQLGHMETEAQTGRLGVIGRELLTSTILTPQRFGDPEEYAHLCQTIIENPIVNGEIIRLDGGARLYHLNY